MKPIKKQPKNRLVATFTVEVYSDSEPGIVSDMLNNPLNKLYLAVANYTGVDFSQSGRTRKASDIRTIFTALALQAGHQIGRIARTIGRNHSTVCMCRERHAALLETNHEYRELYHMIKNHLQLEGML